MVFTKNYFFCNQVDSAKAIKLLLLFSLCATCNVSVAASESDDTTAQLVSRLPLEGYKATLKGLTQFGDRRQGTTRNRDALTWIEQQLVQMGCDNVERMTFSYDPEPRVPRVRKIFTNHPDPLKTYTDAPPGPLPLRPAAPPVDVLSGSG